MDIVSSIPKAVELAREVYGDYNTGKQVRLGNYRGPDNVKKLGHYNNKGKLLGIYHGP